MTENGLQVTILTESGIAYYYDTNTSLFQQITSENYQLSTSVTTLDGYTIFAKQDSQEFFISANRDTSTYAALDFALAESNSDNLISVQSFNGQLILMGSISSEIWYDSGAAAFPFESISGAFIQIGTTAKYSSVIDLTGLYFIGSDRVVYNATNYNPQRISTFGIEKILEGFATVDDMFGFIYVQAGHRFLILTSPSENRTLCHDITTGLWHERSSVNPNNLSQTSNAWLANCHASFAGEQLIGDANTGTIYELDLENYQENTTPILWKIISATQFDEYRRDSIGRFVLWMDTGTGISTGQGSDPQIMMRSSKDGGKTFSNELWQPMGEQGNYCTEVWWDQVEFGRTFIAELSGSDPVNIAITGAFVGITQGKA